MSTALSAVLFDLGGVVDDVNIAWGRDAWGALGRDVAEFEQAVFESGIKYKLDRGLCTAAEGLAAVSHLVGGAVSPDEARGCFNAVLRVRPPVVAAMRKLAEQTRVAVISNTDAIHAAWIQKETALGAVVEQWIFSFEHGEMKPADALFRRAAAVLHLRPDQTLLIDDRADNCEAARALGFETIRFEAWDQVKEQLAARGLKT